MNKLSLAGALLILVFIFVSGATAQTSFTILHNFTGGTDDGRYPLGGLVSDGTTLYGMTRTGGASDYGVVFALQSDGYAFTLIHNFTGGTDDGQNPWGSLIADGSTLYGMTYYGGDSNEGTVFSLLTGGAGFTLLHDFAGGSDDGENPYGTLLSAGTTLYGMTSDGGASGYGTVFSLGNDASGFTLLHSFLGSPAGGDSPRYAALLPIGSVLYGTTRNGGTAGDGTLFSVGTDGSGFTLLHSFSEGETDNGDAPVYGVIADGSTLYGVTEEGGPYRKGTVYSVGTDGSGFTILHFFQYDGDGGTPEYERLVSDGQRLYGTTYQGGDADRGTVFATEFDGSGHTTLHSFLGRDDDGAYPYGGLDLSGSTLYGLTTQGGSGNEGVAFSIGTDGSGFTLLHTFTSDTDNGRAPYGVPVVDGSTLYGLTVDGGQYGWGTAFSLGIDGSAFTILHHFNPLDLADAASPYGGVILGGSTLYGMTYYGGSEGRGTVFSLGTDGSAFTLLHGFTWGTGDGGYPFCNDLILDGSTLYGMSTKGGADNHGVVFSLGADGSDFTVLHEFQGGTSDGRAPTGALALDGSTLYGMTPEGGTDGGGVIFSVETDGTGHTIRHHFSQSSGWHCRGSLVKEGGAFYGPTSQGGDGDGYWGTIFTIQPDGSGYTLLHSFAIESLGGVIPVGRPALIDSTLYGMTHGGGANQQGTIFALGQDGTGFTIVHDFTGDPDGGDEPDGSLLAAGSRLFGMTSEGGSTGSGTVFSLRFLTPTPTISATPTATPTPTGTPSPTASPTPTAGPSSTPSSTPTPVPTASPTPSLTPTPTPWPTPEYLVIAAGDYTGDGISDIAVFRQDNGLWAVRGLGRVYYGRLFDIPASGDYDGDGIADIAVFRPSIGLWAVKNLTRIYLGGSGDIPVPGDYDGDGSCDPAVFRKSSGLWRAMNVTAVYFGASSDLPVPADYDDDGTAEIAVFRPANGLWAVRGLTRTYLGTTGDRPIPAVYRWDGGPNPFPAVPGIFRPATGMWAVRGVSRIYYGAAGDTPIPAAFSGYPLADPAVFRSSVGLWAIRNLTRIYYGRDGDSPVSR